MRSWYQWPTRLIIVTSCAVRHCLCIYMAEYIHTRLTNLTRHNCIRILYVYVYLATASTAQLDTTFDTPNKNFASLFFFTTVDRATHVSDQMSHRLIM